MGGKLWGRKGGGWYEEECKVGKGWLWGYVVVFGGDSVGVGGLVLGGGGESVGGGGGGVIWVMGVKVLGEVWGVGMWGGNGRDGGVVLLWGVGNKK
uniref:Uncharacterized protein n=1 Tax=Knipowitschia caucasica TaxID=637954 RepID=A0AAV2LPA5_KNICA